VISVVPTYRRTGSALHAARPSVAIFFCAACCVPAVVFDNPIVVLASIGAATAAALAAKVGHELAHAARLALPLAALVALINPLVSQQGLTVLVDGPVVPVMGNVDITLEAVVWGAVAGLRVLAVFAAFALYSACVDPDDVLRLFGRVAPRSALTASLATRTVPVLGRDAARMAEAYSLRATSRGERPRGRRESLHRAARLTRALGAGALERSIELASALEVRGYAGARRLPRKDRPWSRHDTSFALAASAIVLVAIAGRLAGLAGFHAYPLVELESARPDLALALAIPVIAVAPFVGAAWTRRSLRRRYAHA
jgi:energy-coupling factor transport system permease protein